MDCPYLVFDPVRFIPGYVPVLDHGPEVREGNSDLRSNGTSLSSLGLGPDILLHCASACFVSFDKNVWVMMYLADRR